MEFNLAIRFKSHPLIEEFGIGVFPGLGVVRLEGSEFLRRMDVDGKAAAVD